MNTKHLIAAHVESDIAREPIDRLTDTSIDDR